ncbi:MAG: N-acetyl-D-Glu racemase DgcA [Rhodospirillaceae bacterium]
MPNTANRRLSAVDQAWPLARPFVISRGAKYTAQVVVAEIEEGTGADGAPLAGRGECVPYSRYGETVESVILQIASVADAVAGGISRGALHELLPPGAARNAVDCALWDLEAKRAGKRVWEIAGLPAPKAMVTTETVALGSAQEMAIRAAKLKSRPLLKVKLDGEGVRERMQAVRDAAPDARLIVDPNEGWDMGRLVDLAPVLADLGVEMIEQPLPAAVDAELEGFTSPVPICADEACHTAADLERLAGKYQMVNVKLDKAGGLTEALKLADAAEKMGFGIMAGCMVSTSLAMAPMTVLMNRAAVVDLDGPLLLKKDREGGLDFTDGRISPPDVALWG